MNLEMVYVYIADSDNTHDIWEVRLLSFKKYCQAVHVSGDISAQYTPQYIDFAIINNDICRIFEIKPQPRHAVICIDEFRRAS